MAITNISNVSLTSTVAENGYATLAGTITDPVTTNTFTVSVTWGDGSTGNIALGATALNGANIGGDLVTWDPTARTYAIQHLYTDDRPSGTSADTYSVTGTVTDSSGGTGSVGGGAGSGAATGGNIFMTGHDILLHNHQNGYDAAVLDYLRGVGTPNVIARADYDIGYLRDSDRGVPGGTGVGFNTSQFGHVFESSMSAFTTADQFQAFLDKIDVLYIPWYPDLSEPTSSNKLAQFAPQIAAFINRGGDIAIESSTGQNIFYSFLPPGVAASGPAISGSTGFAPTAAGAAVGITSAMTNGNATHNSFTSFDDDFVVLETRGSEAISIGVRNATVGAGGISTGLTVTVTNVAPVAANVAGAATEDGAPQTFAFSATDAGGDPLTYTVLTQPSEGVVTNNGNGTFSFAPGAGFQSLAAGETKTVSFTYRANDDDGGQSTPATVTLTVTGVNDAPVLAAQGAQELVVNGGFEAGDAGWSNASGAGVETNPAGVYGVSGATGRVMEVDVNGGAPADDISQTVATTAGGAYVFSFDAAVRSGFSPATCSFEVLWNGVVIDTVTPTSTGMQHYSYTVFGAGSTGTLEFREPGASDGVGGIVDNVSLVKAVAEVAGQTGASSPDSGSTVLSFTDVDLIDTHSVSVGAPSLTWSGGAVPAGLAASLTGAVSTTVTEAAGAGSIVATFAAPDATFDFLAAGQTLKVVYNVSVSDGHGGVSTQAVSFLVAGSNDGPSLVAANTVAAGTVAELADLAPGETTAVLSAGGIVAFADADLSDVHSATFTANGAAYVGTFALSPVDQAGDKVGWTFTVPDGVLDHLGAGQQLLQTYTVQVADGHGGTVSQLVSVTLAGSNDGPVAISDTAATIENQAVSVDVLANDTDVDDGATRALLSVGAPAGKGVAAIVDGKVQFTPGADFDHLAAGATETVTLSYVMQDDQGATATSTVLVTVTGTNDGPVANADAAAITENQALSLDVLANDTDVDDGAVKSLVSVSGPAGKGVASLVDGKVAFTPGADFDHLAAGATETVTLTYVMQDEQGATATSSVQVTVTGTNDGPVANADAAATTENQSVTVDVLANDTDVDDGATHALVSVSGPGGKGAAAIVDGKVVFTPGADFDHLSAGATETVTLTYVVKDDQGATATSSVLVTVTGTNDAPVVSGVVSGAANEDGGPVSLDARAKASDVDDGATLNVVGVPATLPAGVTYNAASQTFTLAASDSAYQHLGLGQTQVVSVAYGVSDGVVTTAASVSWTVTGTNDAPVARADAGAVAENASLTLNVLGNDTDVDDGDTRSISAVGPTALGGQVSLVDGKIVYLANDDAFDLLTPGQSVVDTFSYTIKDAAGATSTATVSVTVSGVADGADLIGGNQSQNLVGTALDERIFGGNAEDTLNGGAGADRLYGGNGRDLLLGGSGRDQLYGENGTDTLDGGAGNDTLTGGLGGDVFVFGANAGQDIVTDFGNGDVLKFVGAGFGSPADVLAHASGTAGGVLISMSGGASVLLQGVSLSSLSASDFLIA